MSTHTILIEPVTCGVQGQRYRVTYLGRVLLDRVREPLFDACRALAAKGIAGRLEMWRPGRTAPDMAVEIGQGARVAVAETAGHGPVFRQWQPFAAVAEQCAFPAVTGRSRTGGSKFSVGQAHSDSRLSAG